MKSWLKAIQQFGKRELEKIPPKWKTIRQIAKEIKKSESHTGKLVRDMRNKGLAESQTFRVQMGGRIMPVPHYKFKE